MRFRLFLAIILLTYGLSTQGQSNDTGLLFRSYETPIGLRTALHLSPDSPLKFNQSLKISFETTLWRMEELGYLLRFSTPDTLSRIDLLYKPEASPQGVFKLKINGTQDGPEIAIPADKLIRNNWLSVSISLNKTDKRIVLQINDERIEFKTDVLDSISAINAVFGRSPYGLPSSIATPRFGIKNLDIQVDDKRFFWPLSKSIEKKLQSTNKLHIIEVSNSEWIVDTKHKWQLQYTQQVEKMPGIAYDKKTGTIYLVEESLITTYSIGNKQVLEFKPENSFPKDQSTQYAQFSTLKNKLFAYDLQPLNAYSFNWTSLEWENKPTSDSLRIERWQHGPFENTLNGNPMIFGGYGFFKAKNTLLQYIPDASKWIELPLKGDIPEPRFMMGVTEAYNQGQYFIYGGYGNQSGEQDLGFQNLNDLYLLDLNDSSITQFWANSPGTAKYLPSSSMVLNQKDSLLYAVGYSYLDGEKELELLQIHISKGQVETLRLEEKLPFEIRNIGDFNLFLVFSEQTKELALIQRLTDGQDNSEVKVYTISFPPQSFQIVEASTTKYSWWIFLPISTFFFGALIMLIWWRYLAKKRKKSTPAIIEKEVVNIDSAVSILGEFSIKDTNTEITQKLSPKLKELFLLILTYSLSEKKGISTSKLTETLWPDASAASAKNNRGVSLQKLRQALSSVSGLEIKFANNKWVAQFQSPETCDLYQLLDAIQKDELLTVLKITSKGAMLPNTNYEWLDRYKIDFHFKVIQFLIGKATAKKQASLWQEVVDISRAILNIDMVHDEALHLIVNALVKLKKVSMAKTVYGQFCNHYEQLYAEPYPTAFDDLLK